MKNKEQEIQPLGMDFEVLEEAPKPSAAAAATRPGGGNPPLRKSVSNGSIGLLVALAGLLSPYGAPEYAGVAALASAVILWQLLSAGMGRVQATSIPLKPFGAILALVAGGVSLGLGEGGMLGAVLAILGGLLSLAGPALGKKADSKLPPAAPEVAVDNQFSKSLLAYLLILGSLPLAWADGGDATGIGTILGGLTFLFCLLCAWASWVGMWKLWAMPAISAGVLGLVLFLAPLEAFMLGLMGVARVFLGDSMDMLANAWPGTEEMSMTYLIGPLMCLVGGSLAMFELFHGAKKGLEANKVKKETEIAARKAARAARRDDDGKSGSDKGAKEDASAKSSEAKSDKK